MKLKPIAHIKTDFPEKFGIPRQSGRVPELKGKIIFEKDIKYSYQHEFRFYIAADIKKEYLEIRDINLSDIQRIKFELNPDSLKSLKI